MNYSITKAPVYLINLEHRQDRLEHMTILLSQLGFNDVRIVRPFDGTEERRNELISNGYIHPSFNPPSNIISHISTYLSILNTATEEHFIIMEDDLKFNYHSELNIHSLNNLIPLDFDCFFMEYCYEDCKVEPIDEIRLVDSKYQSNLIKKMYSPLCLGAVIYKQSSVQKILSNFRNETQQIDHWFKNAIQKNNIKAYGTYEPLFVQDKRFGTDLQHKGLFNLSNFLFGKAGRPCKQKGINRVLKIAIATGILYKLIQIKRKGNV